MGRKRVLIITDTPPWPPTAGGRQRSNLLHRALQRSFDVDLLLLPKSPAPMTAEMRDKLHEEFGLVASLFPEPPLPRILRHVRRSIPWIVARQLRRFAPASAVYEQDWRVFDWLSRRINDVPYNAIVGRYLRPTVRAGALRFEPVVLDFDDVDTEVVRTAMAGQSGHAWAAGQGGTYLRQLRKMVPQFTAACTALWVVSTADQAALDRFHPELLPNIPFSAGPTPCYDSDSNADTTILIVASLDYRPNAEGVLHFVRRVWPSIIREIPPAQLRIVGSGHRPRLLRQLRRHMGVEAVGFVEDLAAEYDRCAFTIAPVYQGGGTNIKVLESYAFGRACVVTPFAHRGFETALRDGVAICVAQDDPAFSKACIAMLRDSAMRARYARTGFDVIKTDFSFERFEAIVRNTMTRVIEQNPGGVRLKQRAPDCPECPESHVVADRTS